MMLVITQRFSTRAITYLRFSEFYIRSRKGVSEKPMHRLSALDLSLVAIYLVGITLFGLQFRSKDRSLKNYFLADRKIPWWAIALSIVAAETSTLTIISVPG